MSGGNPDFEIVHRFVRTIVRAGVEHVCISPGSRSTPLTMAFASMTGQPDAPKLWTLLDERSSGYFALGLARATRTPVVLVCTSGTAVANYLPAVVEAYQSRVPLVLLTADRPPELRAIGSNQTIDQVRLFGSHVKWAVEMPVPDVDGANAAALKAHAESMAWRCVAVATASPGGPVHINYPFREPLVPAPFDAAGWSPKLERHYRASHVIAAEDVIELLHLCVDEPRGIIVCGPQTDPAFPQAVSSLAARLNWPILADPLSQVRCGNHDLGSVVDTYDILLRHDGYAGRQRPHVVLRFGQTPTSKVLGQRLTAWASDIHVTVDESEHWRDPFHVTTHAVACDPTWLCRQLVTLFDEGGHTPASRLSDTSSTGQWLSDWLAVNEKARRALSQLTVGSADLRGEGQLFRELSPVLREDTWLVVGNSMPVRDADTFFSAVDTKMQWIANRGASGIDGVVSTAFGVSAAASDHADVLLVIGDVSFYHDMNGLLAWSQSGVPLCIILVNNGGGGIFSFLPQAAHPESFAYFDTPHQLDFRHAVDMYGGTFISVADWNAFRDALVERDRDRLTVIEVRTSSQDNVTWNRRIVKQVLEAVFTE